VSRINEPDAKHSVRCFTSHRVKMTKVAYFLMFVTMSSTSGGGRVGRTSGVAMTIELIKRRCVIKNHQLGVASGSMFFATSFLIVCAIWLLDRTSTWAKWCHKMFQFQDWKGVFLNGIYTVSKRILRAYVFSVFLAETERTIRQVYMLYASGTISIIHVNATTGWRLRRVYKLSAAMTAINFCF
jgi:hypothetical protein